MKKLFFVLLQVTIFMSASAQSNDVEIVRETDEMSGKSYLYASKGLLLLNEEQDIGFRIDPFIKDDMTLSMLIVKMANIGRCNENDEIIILFSNGEKLTKKSWKKFNCEGEAYFSLTKKEVEQLRQNPISKIRMTNGRTFESYTGELSSEQSNYFISFLNLLDNRSFVNKKQ